MKNIGLKNIVPQKYNDFFSIHSTRGFSKEKINNLPIITSYSRNSNKSFNYNKNPYFFKTVDKLNKNYNDLSTNKNQEFDNNLEKVPYPSFLRLTNYIKTKNFKNKTKINNQIPPSNKVNEVYFDINRTEYNQVNRKCFSIEVKYNLKKSNKMKLIKNKNKKSPIDELLKKEKEDFKNAINAPNKRNKVINDFSYIIYHHFFPVGKQYYTNYNNFNCNQIKNNDFNKFHLLNNLSNKKISIKTERGNNFIKQNTFFEIIIEKVMHMVEYKNQLNQEISINIVKNLLNEEINSMYKCLNNKNNCSKITYESIRINKSTSTDDNFNFSDFRHLNTNYDNYDRYSNASMSEINFEKIARKKLERKLSILNNKYGFEDNGNDEIPNNYDIISHSSSNYDNYNQSETDNIIRSKKNIQPDNEEDDDNAGDFIISTANNINDNLNDYKNNNLLFNHSSIFKTANIKNLLNQFYSTNKTSNKQGLHDFKTFKIIDKKNININEYKNSIIELYRNFLEIKERIKEMEDNQMNQNQNKKTNHFYDSGTNVPIFNNSNQNSDNSNKKNQKVKVFSPKFSTNVPIDDFFNRINKDEEFENFINGFGGYYNFGEKKNIKEILKKMKEENEVVKFKYNVSNTSRAKKNNKSLFTSNNKGILNKATEKVYKDKEKNNNLNTKPKNININENNKNDKSLSNDKKKYSNKNISNKSNNNEQEKDNNINMNDNNNLLIENNKDMIPERKKERTFTIFKENTLEKKLDLTNINKNDNFNELEKEFIKQTNNLNNLTEKDKKQILTYLKEIESIHESAKNGSMNFNLKIKIKKLHYLIEQYILELYKKGLVKTKSKEKGTKDIFKLLKNRNFEEKQKRINEFGEEEEESEDAIHIINSSDNEIDIDSIFIKGKGRSKSVDIKKLKSYYKVYHILLFKKIKKKKKFRKHRQQKKNSGEGSGKYL